MMRKIALFFVVAFVLSLALWYGLKVSAEKLRDQVLSEASGLYQSLCASKVTSTQGYDKSDSSSEHIQHYTWLALRQKVLDDIPLTQDGHFLLGDLDRALQSGIQKGETASPDSAFLELLSAQVNLSDLLVNDWRVAWMATEGDDNDILMDLHALRALTLVQTHALLNAIFQGHESSAIQAHWSKLSSLSGIACQSGSLTALFQSKYLWDAVERTCRALVDSASYDDFSRLPALEGCLAGDLGLEVLATIDAHAESAWGAWIQGVRGSGFFTSITARILKPLHTYNYWRFLDGLIGMTKDGASAREYQGIWNPVHEVQQDGQIPKTTGPKAVFLATLPPTLEHGKDFHDPSPYGSCIDYFEAGCNGVL